MFSRHVVLMVLLVSLSLVLAACDTAGDDDVAEAADDTVAETTDDFTDDTAESETATDDIDVTGDDEIEASDEADNDYPTNMNEVAELLASEEFALCSDQDAVEAVDTIVPELDLASLEAETHDRTFVAEAYTNTYVGEITDDLLIGISLDNRYADQADGVSVYLCDSHDVSIYLWGDIEDGSASMFEDDVEVELAVSGDEISGTVTMAGGEEQSFTASEASGDAGMYVATDTAGDIDVEVRWVIAADGRQRGRIVCCWPTSHITFSCGCCLQQR